jgi:hypothetical protein
MRRLLTRRWRIGIIVFLLATALAAHFLTSGVQISVSNKGNTPLHDVTLQVSGQSYSLGTIPSMGTASVRVFPSKAANPGGHSQLGVAFAGKSGERTQLDVDTYFESGYRGNIEIDVRDGQIANVRGHARPFLLP